jgi:hypothetical protein
VKELAGRLAESQQRCASLEERLARLEAGLAQGVRYQEIEN